jgi:pimeloyl-ACP methyl ester carboxylesterase
MIVGDPLVARVKRDLPGVEVRGYPVQVCHTSSAFSVSSPLISQFI